MRVVTLARTICFVFKKISLWLWIVMSINLKGGGQILILIRIPNATGTMVVNSKTSYCSVSGGD